MVKLLAGMHIVCKRKTPYDSWAIAKKVASDIRKRKDLPIHPYYCRACHKFHVGKTPRSKKGHRRIRRTKRAWQLWSRWETLSGVAGDTTVSFVFTDEMCRTIDMFCEGKAKREDVAALLGVSEDVLGPMLDDYLWMPSPKRIGEFCELGMGMRPPGMLEPQI